MALLFARNPGCLFKACIVNSKLLTKTTGISGVRGLAEATNKTISYNWRPILLFKRQNLLLFPRCILLSDNSAIRGLKLHRFFSTGSALNNPTHTTKSKNKTYKNLFDIDTDVQKDVLLFSCHKADAFYTFFSWFGLIFPCLAIGIGEMAWTSFGKIPNETEEEKQEAWYNRFSLRNKVLRYAFMVLIALVALSGIGLGFMVPMRAVREIHLLAGGKMGRIVTFGPFGRNRTIERPLAEILPLHSRTEHKSALMIKIEGYRFFFNCDTAKGIFHEEQLYDFTVGSKNTL
ncbi:transmembrane protein 223-like [Ylistrum balloti]|uniref:transmembrane protein 223-like n=1 Tax=Ylistrum balloti TaxID=509963 RepID=UPI002905CEDC|nr:transmembrane protein 223-like [Ylistrum balloti]